MRRSRPLPQTTTVMFRVIRGGCSGFEGFLVTVAGQLRCCTAIPPVLDLLRTLADQLPAIEGRGRSPGALTLPATAWIVPHLGVLALLLRLLCALGQLIERVASWLVCIIVRRRLVGDLAR